MPPSGTLVDNKGKIRIPGMYDSVAPLTDEERNLYEKIEFDLEEYCQDSGVKKLLHGTKASNSFQLIVLHKISFRKLPLLSCLCYLSQFGFFFFYAFRS